MTAIPFPTAEEAKVALKVRVTASGEITPFNVPVIVAVVVPSSILFLATGVEIVNSFGVISAKIPVGCVSVYFPASAPDKVAEGIIVKPVPIAV